MSNKTLSDNIFKPKRFKFDDEFRRVFSTYESQFCNFKLIDYTLQTSDTETQYIFDRIDSQPKSVSFKIYFFY